MLFTLNATALLYYYFRACRTDPGYIKATEEEKKKVGGKGGEGGAGGAAWPAEAL